MSRITRVLPTLSDYLQMLESYNLKDYPCLCLDSSIILYSWLIKKAVNCKIIAGYHTDSVKGHDTIHFWVETKDIIIDGTAIQFLLSDYNMPIHYKDIEHIVNKADFLLNNKDDNYNCKVNAFINEHLQKVINQMVSSTRDRFADFMEDVQVIYCKNNTTITESKEYMMFSSLYKIDAEYYGMSLHDFKMKCLEKGMGNKLNYIVQY